MLWHFAKLRGRSIPQDGRGTHRPMLVCRMCSTGHDQKLGGHMEKIICTGNFMEISNPFSCEVCPCADSAQPPGVKLSCGQQTCFSSVHVLPPKGSLSPKGSLRFRQPILRDLLSMLSSLLREYVGTRRSMYVMKKYEKLKGTAENQGATATVDSKILK